MLKRLFEEGQNKQGVAQMITVSCNITTLKAKTSKLTGFIPYSLCELYSNHGLDLFNRCRKSHINMTGNSLLDLILTRSSTMLGLTVTNKCVLGKNCINNYLIGILLIQRGINFLGACLINVFVSRAGGIFV